MLTTLWWMPTLGNPFLPSFLLPTPSWFTMLCPYAAQWVIQLHTYEHSLSYSFPLYLLQSTEYSSLCYSGGPCLSIIYVYVIYITIYHNLPLLIYFAGMLLTALDTSCGWNHPVFVFLWLALLLSTVSWRFIYVAACGRISFPEASWYSIAGMIHFFCIHSSDSFLPCSWLLESLSQLEVCVRTHVF